MTFPEALHTAARRYCIERHAFWTSRYLELARQGRDRRGSGYTPEALATFPRYNVLKAILVDIERLDATTLGNFTETKELLLLAGMTADDEFTRHSKDDIERSVVQEEREMFSQFVQNLSGVQSQAVQPLPFRRVLSPNESSELWSRLRERWGISGGYWYPLAHEARQDIEASQDEPFHDAVPAEILRTILEEQGVRRVWELRESEPHYEEELDWFDPCYNGAEGYWSSAEMDWIIDASHESSVTVGGWMLERIKARWPSWHENRWTSLSF